MQDLLQSLSHIDILGFVIVSINLVLLIFSKPIINKIYHDAGESTNGTSRKLMIFRAFNVLIIIAYGYYRFYYPVQTEERVFLLQILAAFAVLYISYLAINISHYFIVRHYGKVREIQEEKRFIPTYRTRLLGIFSGVFISLVGLIAILQILDLSSLLQAGGVIGFIGVFLALTQSTWAPDIFNGLIILNSDMVQEGDVIQVRDGEDIYGLVYKTKMFHTVILNLIDNHRVMIRNSKLREYTIHNLSRFASAKGLRERVYFKIGYDTPSADVRAMFEEAFTEIAECKDLLIERQHKLELAMDNTGDHAVEWVVYYYTKQVDSLISTRQKITEIIHRHSVRHNVSLSTPLTHQSVS